MSDGTLPKGEFKQNERGFYHFYAAQPLSDHDCRRVAAMLKAFNLPDKRKGSAPSGETL